AQIIVTAGQLKASSKLRKAFESHPAAYAVGLYDDPPSRGEIERSLLQAGLENIPHEPMSALTELAGELSPGDFSQTIEKLSLYKRNDTSDLTIDDIESCAPISNEAALDDVLNVVAEGRTGEIGPMIRRLQAQGTNAVAICIGATRHFRILYACASDPGGAAQGIGRLRPPVFGKRRDRILRQAQGWGARKLETALTVLTDTDLKLRSAAQTAPAMALVERAMIRIAMLARSR
ncbi:MAG: DNA polymerase III subunit delta, partial [Ruegeria sp.]